MDIYSRSWYVLYVKTGCEDKLKQYFKYNFYDDMFSSLVPKRCLLELRQGKYYKVIKKLFPGYVFINTYMQPEVYYTIKNIPKVYRVLNTDNLISSVPDKEMNPILNMVDENGLIDISKISWENKKIIVTGGPLLGYEALIKRIDMKRKRAKVEFSVGYSVIRVDLGVYDISKISG